MLNSSLTKKQLMMSWFTVLSAGLFFFYSHIELNIFNAINIPLMKAFHIDASLSSELSATTLLAVLICVPFAGTFIDRFSTRKLIIITLFFSSGGIALLAISNTVSVAFISRFLTGVGSAFCFLSCIKLASRWFPSRYVGIVVGVLVTMATAGGMVAQKPVTDLVSIFGWRNALWMDALLGLVIIIWIYCFVQNYPNNAKKHSDDDVTPINQISILSQLKLSYLDTKNWMFGLYTGFINLPFWILGASWGIPFLTQVYKFDASNAANITSMLYLGIIFGSPTISIISNYIGKRRLIMSLGASILFILLTIVTFDHGLRYASLSTFFFLIGFCSGVQVLTYPIVAEISSTELTATSVSVISFATMLSGAVSQILFGHIMDSVDAPKVLDGISTYPPNAYMIALLLLPATALVSIILAYKFKQHSN